MTDEQWELLLAVVRGDETGPPPVAFIIDSPWLPGWAGMTILDYFTSDALWFEANARAVGAFPDVIFLPGFWSEFGMCTEPSAFGARSVWSENDFPHPGKIVNESADIDRIDKPHAKSDGLLPFVLKRLAHHHDAIRRAGHEIRIATSRGPLNIAAFLMGTTEFLMAAKTEGDRAHNLLDVVTDFIIDWLDVQREAFPSIDGVFLLDDIVGFLGDDDFREFARPYLARVYASQDVSLKFFHNDSQGMVCAPHLAEIGVNLFNFSFEHSVNDMRQAAGPEVALLGNIPPRDVLAAGTPDDVARHVRDTVASLAHPTRLILSCGGGIPPDVPSDNIRAFCDAARRT